MNIGGLTTMAHCTECGSELPEAVKFCGACGTAIESSIAAGSRNSSPDQRSLATLMGMAKTAEIGLNNAEALEYYNRALEIDPAVAEAWIGKGKAASWQSTLANFRVSEGLIAFQHAIANAGERREAIINEVNDELNKIVVALYNLSRNHLGEFAALDQTWSSYLGHVAQMLEALEQALNWSPRNRITLENIVHLTKDNIEGYKYWDNIHQVSGLHGITPEYERTLSGLMDRAVTALREIDETYSAPVVEKKQADACFVVTATLGDSNHPDVILLRQFRDDWISKKLGGHSFISWYYRAGPRMASWIEQTTLRRRISYHLIVRPAVRFALRVLYRN
jgi:tetratricopeptide (TPR) repeat protein